MTPLTPQSRAPADTLTQIVAWSIGPAFLVLAAFMAFGPSSAPPIVATHPVSRDQLEPGPLRRPMVDPPQVKVGPYVYGCNECHSFFQSASRLGARLVQHTDIRLVHGLNDRCANCHDVTDRERLRLRDGTTVSFAEAASLCVQCHGTVFRDWQRGTHGKTLGHWDRSAGDAQRLQCTQCHNPHAPAYPPIAPLPGPNTLRMGDQNVAHAPDPRHRPLRQWSGPKDAHR